MVKRKVLAILLAAVFLLFPPLTLLLAGVCLPSQFGDTYYGELSCMFDNLCKAKGKKIVLVGNSAVAFGVNGDLLQAELPDYTVVNFGLYGVLGTKLMLDLSKANISEGDVIVVMPEPIRQSSSLYFSGKEVWRAIEGDFSMLRYVSKENRADMVGNYVGYVAEKFGYFQREEKPTAEGVYSRRAFLREDGENAGYITYDRPYNVMAGGYDSTFSSDSFGTIDRDFLNYLNEYNDYAKKRGATVYYGFCPVNSLAFEGEEAENFAESTYAVLQENLDFELIGHPSKYFLDYHWFYDNNVHLNSAGMYIYTDLLAEDVKLKLGIYTPNQIPLPEMPEIPTVVGGAGDNTDADMFVYERVDGADGKYIRLTALTEEGKTRRELTLPADYDGIPVREFSPLVFQGNTIIAKIVLPENIRRIYDGSFDGASRLSELIFHHDTVLGLNIGSEFLGGAENCYIYLKKGVNVVDCAGSWEQYQSRIRYY